MPVAVIDELEINYHMQGSGPHLLMLAPGGFNSTIESWTRGGVWKEMDSINALSKSFTVIAYDRREAGVSGGRVEKLTWEVFARQGRAILDHFGVKQAWVVGGCMGVSVAAAMGVLCPERCAGLLLHWPVGGYLWMQKGRGFYNRHIEFVRANGLAAAAARGPAAKNFWLDPEAGPWASQNATDPAFTAAYVKHDVAAYLDLCAQSRDALYGDTMPSGASGEQLLNIKLPALILPGADASHSTSSAWAMKELMPNAEFWNVLPPHQNGENVLAAILDFVGRTQ
ncbi:MAG: alpha/beta hydrolase [Betaproteobacteria bacterium]|nr:alpha/beta hydrolase [Betaproteobacteria bacterium]